MSPSILRRSFLGLAMASGSLMAWAAPVSVLFVGNSYTFGRVDPVMSYNTAGVKDLTANMAPGNAFEPHPWGGVAGIFKQFTVQAGLDYEVSMSARNAASLRGHAINPNNIANLDLLGNIGSQTWNKVVLQEQSDEPLTKRPGLNSNPDYFKNYANKLENYIHKGAAQSFQEQDFFPGASTSAKNAACIASGLSNTTCTRQRSMAANAKASNATDVYLYQTWARPNLIDGAFVTTVDPTTGAVTRTATKATTFFNSLEAMTEELVTSYDAALALADDDLSPGFKGVVPVGEAFLRAVQSGVATRDMWGAQAMADGLLDLWFDDGTHASKYGSYLSALTLFGQLTGVDPQSLGANEKAAFDLGIQGNEARILQRVAAAQLGFAVPEPASLALLMMALGAMGLGRRTASQARTNGA